MLSKIAKKNLLKDKQVLGKKWTTTYGGYFSDASNINQFIKTLLPYLPDKPLSILYAASASGLLGEALLHRLERGELTIVDISQTHLDENNNPHTTKICADLVTMDLAQKFDLILMRSSLDYFPSAALQVEILKNIKRHLVEHGLFVNQPAYIEDLHERDLMSQLYIQTEKIGDRFFQSTDLADLYLEAGFSTFTRIGEGEPLQLTQQDHIDRYGLNNKDIQFVLSMIPDHIHSMQKTADEYRLFFQFPIFLAS